MRDSDKFLEAIDDMVEILIGKRPNHTNRAIEKEMNLMERARDENGRYIGDDPTTEHINEAWVSPFPTPKPSIQWTRKQLIDYCNEFGVLHSDDDSKLQLLDRMKETYPNGL